ncbi:DJ-1/PfpI family protein [Marinobacterium stanieri]|uniref:DJ-1/PfpI family protein n=1 Tax=Marinobacterium stanieri TaxID=49186 RepID=A0A1N6US62_9GAMM|nr:DJ-1/PfpI family protein [Marinobacterium stanieri]SIQ68483.1 DJ-1/PfpI family protein [Marinobacterium stanieri]
MHVSILTFEGFNELDSFIALGILNRMKDKDWRISIASPTKQVTSMNGVVIESHLSLPEACQTDAILIGSGIRTREVIKDASIMSQLTVDPNRQLLGAQCSGSLLLAQLGLLESSSVCSDLTTRPWLLDKGIDVLDQPIYADKNVASAGGCMASQYLAAWVIARLDGIEAAAQALHYVAPVGEKEEYVARAMNWIEPCLNG